MYYSLLYLPNGYTIPYSGTNRFRSGHWICQNIYDQQNQCQNLSYQETVDMNAIYAFFRYENGQYRLDYIGLAFGDLYHRVYHNMHNNLDRYYTKNQEHCSLVCYMNVPEIVNIGREDIDVHGSIYINMEQSLILTLDSPGNHLNEENNPLDSILLMENPNTHIRDTPVDFLQTVENYYLYIISQYETRNPNSKGLFPNIKEVYDRNGNREPCYGAYPLQIQP